MKIYPEIEKKQIGKGMVYSTYLEIRPNRFLNFFRMLPKTNSRFYKDEARRSLIQNITRFKLDNICSEALLSICVDKNGNNIV